MTVWSSLNSSLNAGKIAGLFAGDLSRVFPESQHM
mgnify:CR=1 FL=1